MDDFNNQDNENRGFTDNRDIRPMGDQNVYGYQPYQPGYQYPPPKPPKKKSGLAGIIISIVVVCLLIGGLVTAYLIMPLLGGASYVQKNPAAQASATQQAVAEASIPPAENAASTAPAVVSPAPQLGGQAPAIDQSNNPVVQIADKVGSAVVCIEGHAKQFTRGRARRTAARGRRSLRHRGARAYLARNRQVAGGPRRRRRSPAGSTRRSRRRCP
jgi:hypothetical protein